MGKRAGVLLIPVLMLVLVAGTGCPPKKPPTAAFSAAPTSGSAPLTVQFTDQSTAGSAAIKAWAWNFGDGQADTVQNPAHQYATAGTYSVSLAVTSDAGSNTATMTDLVHVSEAPVPPTAAFTAVPTSGNAPLTVQFTDQSTPGNATITNWSWSFGDTQGDTVKNPSHTYAAAGTYTVSLTVTTANGSNTLAKASLIRVTEPGGPQVEPTSGAPGAMVKITIPGNVLDSGNPMQNSVVFGDKAMTPSNVTDTEITTAVPPLATPGLVALRVEVGGTAVLTGFNFEILASPPLTAPAGTVAADAANRVVDTVTETVNIIKPMLALLDQKAADAMGAAMGAIDQQVGALQPVMDYAKEHGELELLDRVFVSSGFAAEIQDIHAELQKRLAWSKEMDALEAALDTADPAKAAAKRLMTARQRFILDWLGARLHLAMDYANVAMVALGTAAAFSPGAGLFSFGGTVAICDLLMAQLNMVYVFIEASPTELVPDSLSGQVGKNNAVATNSSAAVEFMGDFKSEKNLDQTVFTLFFGVFAEHLGIPRILAAVLEKIGDALLESAEHPDEHKYIIPPLPPDPDMPIYAFEFMEGLNSHPPSFDGGSIATLSVSESRIYAGDKEGGPFNLVATQKVYRFKGGFFMPGEPPHIEKEEASITIPVTVKKGLKLVVQQPVPQDPPPPLGDPLKFTVSGQVTNWDDSPVDDTKVHITIEYGGGQVVVITPTGGSFSEDVAVPPGKTTITVTGDDGETTATEYVMVLNAALPATYCVVTNVSGDSLSLIDPASNTEFYRVQSTDVDNVLDGPRDAAFLPDAETLLVLNSAAGTTPALVALRLVNLAEITTVSTPLELAGGKSWAMALSPDHKTAVVTCCGTASALHVVDVRQPDTLRLVKTINFTAYDAYGPANVCTTTGAQGASLALVSTGNYLGTGTGKVVVVDISTPYGTAVLGSVEVAARGGAIAAIPGQSLAVVSGTSLYNADTQKVDGAVAIVDFSNPAHPVVRGTLALGGAFPFGLAVMPGGNTALVTDAGNPLKPSNRLLQYDISNPDLLVERTPGSPLKFHGTGCPRIGLSPDGQYAAIPTNVSNAAVVIDVSNLDSPVVGDSIDVDTLPFGVVFRPPLP